VSNAVTLGTSYFEGPPCRREWVPTGYAKKLKQIGATALALTVVASIVADLALAFGCLSPEP